MCGADIVIMAAMLECGRIEVATTPPMEWPIRIIEVPDGYSERMYSIARVTYRRCESRVGPWNAERSSLNSTARRCELTARR